jgi:hypothetical protein
MVQKYLKKPTYLNARETPVLATWINFETYDSFVRMKGNDR